MMEDKVAVEVLKELLSKYSLDEKEKEAVRTAIGVLAWTKLVEGKIKGMKKRREERANPDSVL